MTTEIDRLAVEVRAYHTDVLRRLARIEGHVQQLRIDAAVAKAAGAQAGRRTAAWVASLIAVVAEVLPTLWDLVK